MLPYLSQVIVHSLIQCTPICGYSLPTQTHIHTQIHLTQKNQVQFWLFHILFAIYLAAIVQIFSVCFQLPVNHLDRRMRLQLCTQTVVEEGWTKHNTIHVWNKDILIIYSDISKLFQLLFGWSVYFTWWWPFTVKMCSV
jgi:hypothetical protein